MNRLIFLSGFIPIGLVVATLATAMVRGVDIPAAFAQGVQKGFRVCKMIFPNILLMITAITVFRAAGGVELFCNLVAPVFNLLGIPPETAQIVLLRPFSGSGALALAKDIMGQYGVESYIGKIAAVMLGASETSIYTIGVYTGYLGLKNTKHLLFCALCADFVVFLSAVWCVRFMMGG